MKRILSLLLVALLIGCAQAPVAPEQSLEPQPVEPQVPELEQEIESPDRPEADLEEPEVIDSRLYDSEESCEAAEGDCVAVIGADGLTGQYVAYGDVLEGEQVDIGFSLSPNDLCSGDLRAVRDLAVSESGACLAPACACYVCTNCGDGVCGGGENECNCPEDCQSDRPVFQPEEECEASGDFCVPLLTQGPALYVKAGSVKEGESFSVPHDMTTKTRVCEEGLFAVTDIKLNSDGSCSGLPLCQCYVCLKCGDGICGPGENYCNCNRDCFIKE